MKIFIKWSLVAAAVFTSALINAQTSGESQRTDEHQKSAREIFRERGKPGAQSLRGEEEEGGGGEEGDDE